MPGEIDGEPGKVVAAYRSNGLHQAAPGEIAPGPDEAVRGPGTMMALRSLWTIFARRCWPPSATTVVQSRIRPGTGGICAVPHANDPRRPGSSGPYGTLFA